MTADDRMIHRRAIICQTFPAYRFEDLTDTAARPLLRGMRLLSIQTKAGQSR